MRKYAFPSFTSLELNKLLKKRVFENLSVLKSVESQLIKARKYVFKLPKPGTPVVLLVSGGLDSITTWDILLRQYHLKVYPLFLNKGEKRKRHEESSVDYFANYFQGLFPDLFISPYKQTTLIPQQEVIDDLGTPFSRLQLPNTMLPAETTTNIFLGSPGIVPFYAMTFARYLEVKEKVRVRSIFSSVMAGDGTVCPSQSLTSLRVINLGMCAFTGEYDWQMTSIAVEKELGHHLTKADYIKYANTYHLPLEKTWSCYKGLELQCGECLACQSRRSEFEKAEVEDRTSYLIDRPSTLLHKVTASLRHVFDKVA